jgi:hypothetical protein
MDPTPTRLLLTTMQDHVRQTRRAYYQGMPGVTYEDMQAAARRFLEMKASIDRANGRKAAPVTSAAIAHLLRAL